MVVPLHSPRAAAVSDLEAAVRVAGIPALSAGSVGEGLAEAARISAGGVVVVSGSVFLVGEARSWLLGEKAGA